MNHTIPLAVLAAAVLLAACADAPNDPAAGGGAPGRLTILAPSAAVVVGADDAGGRLVVRGRIASVAAPRITYRLDDAAERAFTGPIDPRDGDFTLTIRGLPLGTRHLELRLHDGDRLSASASFTVHVAPRMREIVVPAGAGHAFPTAINARGDVTGYWTDPAMGGWHALLALHDGHVLDLRLAGEWRSAAPGLDGAGDAVGYVVDRPDGEPRPVRWRAGEAQALLDRPGTATVINDEGLIGGSMPDEDGIPRAFALRGSTLTLFGEPGRLSGVRGINRVGAMVGASYGRAGDVTGFVYANGTLTTLPSLGGVRTFAEAINDAGTIVGYSADAAGSAFLAFAYRDGKMERLPGVEGSIVASYAYDVNASGMIVGELIDARDGVALNRGFLHVGGRTVPLDELLGLSTHAVVAAYGINDRGEIAAAAVRLDDPTGRIRPVVLAVPGGIDAVASLRSAAPVAPRAHLSTAVATRSGATLAEVRARRQRAP
ncbi:MAG TPA: hypothetical protein VEA99_04865 [Gemmatimonadaceae bacterium]|nr:hypothetical protein [Gemmatimonadaceae bacterium]